jgi:hypothetical protein
MPTLCVSQEPKRLFSLPPLLALLPSQPHGLTSLRATALLAAPHEAVEAHWLDLPSLWC